MLKHAFLKSAVCVGIAAAAWAQDARVEVDELGDDAPGIQVDGQALIDDTGAAPATGAKWIGVGCDPVDDALRAHVDLPQGIGLLVRQVMPASPAFDAGIEKHDILISAGDRKLGTREDLVAAVAAAGDEPIEMKWMHHGDEVTKMVTAVERPWEYRMANQAPQIKFDGEKLGDLDNIRGWIKKLENGAQPRGQQNFKFNFLGPGIQMHQSQSKVLPNGMEISVERDGGDPAKVKVKQGKSSWETTEDKLDMLPEDARGEVESMLNDNNLQIEMKDLGNGGIEAIIQKQMKEHFKEIPSIDDLNIDVPWPRMNERFDEMNRQMEEMMKRIDQLHRRNAPVEDDGNEA